MFTGVVFRYLLTLLDFIIANTYSLYLIVYKNSLKRLLYYIHLGCICVSLK